MATIQEINSTIVSGQFSNAELDSITQAVLFARNQIARQNRGSMVVGTHVQFYARTKGKNITGEVVKVGRKYLTIREHGMNFSNWRVPANMLEVI